MHTDCGPQYAADDYRSTLRDFDGVASMSRKGDPWDNAPVESFFATLKAESFQDIRSRDLQHVQSEALQ
ncbi:MAG: DDE-type integrase/transposase/recombinase [Ignavibacteria bacterium]|nr:DDE-type integrase/transposase/recombinase [Ignavibacteria bacterium]